MHAVTEFSPWPPDQILALYAWGVFVLGIVILVATSDIGPRSPGKRRDA